MTDVRHDDELPIDSTLVRALVDRELPQCAGLPLRRLPATGSTNALFLLGEDLLVRLPRQAGGSAGFRREARWPPHVAPALPVDVPQVLGDFGFDVDKAERVWADAMTLPCIDDRPPARLGALPRARHLVLLVDHAGPPRQPSRRRPQRPGRRRLLTTAPDYRS